MVCEYANLGRMKGSSLLRGANLYSIVVDFRHPASLHGRDPDEFHGAARNRPTFPKELVSNDWWDSLLSCFRAKTRCLFVEYNCANPLCLNKSGIGKKEQLVLLAKRAACIVGIDLFRSSSVSIHRQILSWAREKGKHETDDKTTRVAKILLSTLAPMSLHTNEQLQLTESWDRFDFPT